MLRDKHILITGGAGFIGSRLALALINENRITAFDTLYRNALPDTGLLDHPNFLLVRGDVRDLEAVSTVVKEATHIVHMASIAGVDTVMKNPFATMEVGIKGTFNVLEAALAAPKLECLVDFSTSEVFGRFAYRVTEGDVTALGAVGEARWTYAVSKLATEHLCHVMYRQQNLPTVAIRPFNIFGPGQVGEGAIHHFIVAALNDQPLTVHNDGDQIRAWCYIDDLLAALQLTLESPLALGQTFNVGNPRTAITVYNLAQLVRRLTHSSADITHISWPYPDVELRIPDITRARKILGFTPRFDLETGLQKTIEWYQKQQTRACSRPTTV